MAQRIQLLGHLERMDGQRMPEEILRAQIYQSRKRSRPRIRWLDDLLEYLKRMDVGGYTEMPMDKRRWRRLVLKVRAHAGLKKNKKL